MDTEVLIANPPLILEALQYRSGSETGTQCVEGSAFHLMCWAVHACGISTQKVEAGGAEV